MSSLVYSPSVEAHIATADGKIYDVSADIAKGSVTRVSDGVSSFDLTILNAGRKYDGVFDDQDRIVIYMRRIRRMIVFSGYLDVVPVFSSLPGSITLRGSCTLKRLQRWSWDPNTEAAYQMLYLGDVANRADLTDGGLAKRIVKILSQVAGWPTAQIHVGAIPSDWFTVVAGVARDLIGEATKLQLISHVGSNGYVYGQNPMEKGTQTVQGIGAGTGALPEVLGRLSVGSGSAGYRLDRSASALSGTWYLTMRWPYLDQATGSSSTLRSIPGVNTAAARKWWMGRRVLAVNPRTGKAVCLAAAGWGPAVVDHSSLPGADAEPAERVGATSAAALKALGAREGAELHFAFAPAGMALGVVDTSQGALIASGGGTAGTSLATALGQAVGGKGSSVSFADTAAAWCRKHQGRDYIFGAESSPTDPDPKASDCSELVQWAHDRSGSGKFVDGSANQYASCKQMSIAEAKKTKGALVFIGSSPGSIHHVGISLGDGTTAEAQSTATGCGIFQFDAQRWNFAGSIPDLDYAGSGGTGAGGAPGSTTSDPSLAEPSFGEALLNVFQWIGSSDFGGDLLGGVRALMNDKPFLETVDSLVKAGLRSYCSAPNGDFMSWFPDYFGWWGTAGKMVIQPVEIEQGFTVAKSDLGLKSHWFVTGSTTGVEGFGDATSIYQQYTTAGIASVEFPALMRALFKVDAAEFRNNGKDWLARHGATPQWEPMDNVTGPRQEFFFAVQRFMLNWASQYTAPLPLTFMPELYPGMLAVLPTYGVQAYVQEVTHSFDLRDGAGFTTQASCIAWSTIGDRVGIKGLPKGAPV